MSGGKWVIEVCTSTDDSSRGRERIEVIHVKREGRKRMMTGLTGSTDNPDGISDLNFAELLARRVWGDECPALMVKDTIDSGADHVRSFKARITPDGWEPA